MAGDVHIMVAGKEENGQGLEVAMTFIASPTHSGLPWQPAFKRALQVMDNDR